MNYSKACDTETCLQLRLNNKYDKQSTIKTQNY